MADRLTLFEAVEAVGRMLAAYPHGRPPNERGYIGALAALLLDYPKQVALRATDPRQGVARALKFLPTVADLVEFCERETNALRIPLDREERAAELRQLAQRREDNARHLNADRPRRPSLDELHRQHGPRWGIEAAGKQVGGALPPEVRQLIERANERQLAREFERAGIQPGAARCSPYLIKLLGTADN